jgi:hypothetical protein
VWTYPNANTYILGEDFVQAGQGFLVNVEDCCISFNKGSAGNGFQFHRTTGADLTTLKTARKSWPGLGLLAENRGTTRYTIVTFNEEMTTGLDKSYDVGLLASDKFQLYTHLVGSDSNTDFTIQALPEGLYDQLVVPVGLDIPQGGEVIFKVSGTILPEGVQPILEDRLLKVNTPLRSESDRYTVTVPENTKGIGRFYLHFGNLTSTKIVDHTTNQYSAWYANRKIIISGSGVQDAKASLFDMNGRKLGEYRLQRESRNEIPAEGFANGVYLLHIRSKGGTQVIKVPVVYE